MAAYSGVQRDEEKCIGCRACEVACSMAHHVPYRLDQSNVAGARFEGGTVFSICRHCEDPACLPVCPVGAIGRDNAGIVRIDPERCVGCGICAAACPHGGIRLHPEGSSTKCDLCGGHPLCVAYCPRGAIEYRYQKSTALGWSDSEDLVSPGNSACLGCNAELALRFALRILGKNTVLAIPPGCLGGVGVVGFGMTTGVKVPVFFPLLDNIASMLTGLKREYARKGVDVHAVAFAGDGGTADVGFQCLSAAAERGENILYICYDNEGYMNTGFQRSSTTPFGAWTSTTPVGKRGEGKRQKSKNLPLIMAAHEVPYVATACMSYPADFELKLRKAMTVRDGLAYIHLLTPCPTGWRFPPDKGIEVGRLAVETGFFPLWEMENGVYRFTIPVPRRRSIEDLLGRMGKYSHLSRRQVGEIRNTVERRFDMLKALVKQSER